MRLTNNLRLPESIVRLVEPPRAWQPDEISVTTLIKPPQMVALEREHWDELEEDVSDRMWATYGTMMHRAIQSMQHDNALVEERLAARINGWTVHGTPDLYEADGTLTDFKFASVWSFKDGVKEDYVAQLNCYAWLLREHGFPVHRLQVIALLRDWSKHRAKEDGYPSRQVLCLSVPQWPQEKQWGYLVERLALHQQGSADCSPEERWERPAQWALTKKGNKRATKLHDSLEEAVRDAEMRTEPPRKWTDWWEIIERPGESVRCESYCAVSHLCPQYNRQPVEMFA